MAHAATAEIRPWERDVDHPVHAESQGPRKSGPYDQSRLSGNLFMVKNMTIRTKIYTLFEIDSALNGYCSTLLSKNSEFIYRFTNGQWVFNKLAMLFLSAHQMWYMGAAAYQLENTSPRTITEVKQRWARLVLGWETVQVSPECCC